MSLFSANHSLSLALVYAQSNPTCDTIVNIGSSNPYNCFRLFPLNAYGSDRLATDRTIISQKVDVEIDGENYTITNENTDQDRDYFIPVKSPREWEAFRNVVKHDAALQNSADYLEVDLCQVGLADTTTNGDGVKGCGSGFTCGDPFTDSRDSKVYAIVLMSDGKCWFQENIVHDLFDETGLNPYGYNSTTAAARCEPFRPTGATFDQFFCPYDGSSCAGSSDPEYRCVCVLQRKYSGNHRCSCATADG